MDPDAQRQDLLSKPDNRPVNDSAHEADAAEELLDVTRLTPDERELWESTCSAQWSSHDGPAVRLWSFGYACVLCFDGVPDVVAERLEELDPDNHIRQYQDNVRKARWDGTL